MMILKYAEDKPDDCKYCTWGTSKGKCILGSNNCYFAVKISTRRKDKCEGCPYTKGEKCAGWCTRNLVSKTKEGT